MREIELTQGVFATVDDVDYDYIAQWSWCLNRVGRSGTYAVRGEMSGAGVRRTILMHRSVMALQMGCHDFGGVVDHIDGNGVNNQRGNLRLSTQKQNCENRTALNSNNTSGVRGVSWSKAHGKWEAHVKHNRKKVGLGLYSDIREAESAVVAARSALFTHSDG